MKTKIFVFSSTGNTFKISRDTAMAVGDTEIISIPEAMKSKIDISDCDAIGIATPVYVWGLPNIVANFLKKLSGIENKYIFAIATYGGWPAATLLQAEKLIKERGGKLSSGFAVNMPGNYTPMYGAIKQEKQLKMFQKAQTKIQQIADTVKNRRTGKIEANGALVNILFSGLIYNSSISHYSKIDKGYSADEKCNSCGICAKVCPVDNIKMSNGKPEWLHQCEHCLACLQWCPVEAMQFGKSTAKRKRYRHPEAKLSDFTNY